MLFIVKNPKKNIFTKPIYWSTSYTKIIWKKQTISNLLRLKLKWGEINMQTFRNSFGLYGSWKLKFFIILDSHSYKYLGMIWKWKKIFCNLKAEAYTPFNLFYRECMLRFPPAKKFRTFISLGLNSGFNVIFLQTKLISYSQNIKYL